MSLCGAMAGRGEAFVAAYEALRTYVLTGAAPASCTGLVVLLRKGVAAWMARMACSSSVPETLQPETPFAGHQTHVAVVQVLANMALAHRQEVHL